MQKLNVEFLDLKKKKKKLNQKIWKSIFAFSNVRSNFHLCKPSMNISILFFSILDISFVTFFNRKSSLKLILCQTKHASFVFSYLCSILELDTKLRPYDHSLYLYANENAISISLAVLLFNSCTCVAFLSLVFVELGHSFWGTKQKTNKFWKKCFYSICMHLSEYVSPFLFFKMLLRRQENTGRRKIKVQNRSDKSVLWAINNLQLSTTCNKLRQTRFSWMKIIFNPWLKYRLYANISKNDFLGTKKNVNEIVTM